MKRLFAVLLTGLCALGMFPCPAQAAGADISAQHAALYEPTTGTFLYEKDGSTPAPMASTTKIMTALVAIEQGGDLNAAVSVPSEACGVEGSSLYLQAGECLSLLDLLYGLLLQSANDAAVAIAIHTSGSVEAFAHAMNQRAIDMGLSHTHFANPHGLDDPNHYTTAKELAIITGHAMENSTFRTIVGTKKYTIAKDTDAPRIVFNHNKLLHQSPNAIGVKTGFTKKCGRCLVGAAEQDGLTLISVTLNAPNDWSDHKKLFQLGFSKMEQRLLCSAEDFSFKIPSFNQPGKTVICANSEDVYAILPKDCTSPVPIVTLPHQIPTPQKRGCVVGKIQFVLDDKTVADVPLVIQEITK